MEKFSVQHGDHLWDTRTKPASAASAAEVMRLSRNKDGQGVESGVSLQKDQPPPDTMQKRSVNTLRSNRERYGDLSKIAEMMLAWARHDQ